MSQWQQGAGQQFVQSQQQPTGIPANPYGQQVMQDSGYSGYSTDHLPAPPPRQGQQQPSSGHFPGMYQGAAPQQGTGMLGAQVQQPAYDPRQGQQGPQFQQPLPPQQYQQQPSQPQQQPAQQGPFAPNPNTVLDGPNVPVELRGRTWGEAIRLYNGLATDWRQRQGQQQTPAAQTQQQMGQNRGMPSQFTGQPQGQQPQGQQPTSFFQNPDQRIAEVVRQQIQETIMPALQPMMQVSREQQLMQARNLASQQMPDFQGLESEVVQTMVESGADATNPQVWLAAARMVRGRQVEEGRYRQPAQGQPRLPGQGPGASVPTQQPHQFFSEAPTAPPAFQYGAAGAPQPSQTDYTQAQKFGMSIQDWMLWKTGVPMQGQAVGGAR